MNVLYYGCYFRRAITGLSGTLAGRVATLDTLGTTHLQAASSTCLYT